MRTYLVFVVLAGTFSGCKPSSSETSSAKYPACDSRAVNMRCIQKTAGEKNAISETDCSSSMQGTVVNACPSEKLVGTCVNKQGTAEETTIFYYRGHETDGKDHCDSQQLHNGVYSKK